MTEKCYVTRRQLQQDRDGVQQLTPREQKDLKRHLSSCEDCSVVALNQDQAVLAVVEEFSRLGGPRDGFSGGVLGRIRSEQVLLATPGEVQHVSILGRYPLRAAAAILLVTVGAWAAGLGFWGKEDENSAGAKMAELGDKAEAAVVSRTGHDEISPDESRSSRNLGLRATRLRRTLSRMIELQDSDGSWDRLKTEQLPLDQVALSALAFKAFVGLGGLEVDPESGHRTLNYLLKRQREDGSFSSSMLTTAMVVNVLEEVVQSEGRDELDQYVVRGKRFLRRHRNADGIWSSETGRERDDLLATAFAVRLMGDDDRRPDVTEALRRKTTALLAEADMGGGRDLETRLALCLASRVTLGEDPSSPEVRDAARVLFERVTDPVDSLQLYFKGVFAAHSGGDYWNSFQESVRSLEAANSGSETALPDLDLIEVLSLSLREISRG